MKADLSKGIKTADGIIDFDDTRRLFLSLGAENTSINNVIAFPGLTNSHDHLEFNMFPLLANKTYDDYKEWGYDIHTNNKRVIDTIQKIPLKTRIQFGILKNLINGFTTVVHHGAHHALISGFHYPVVLNYQYLHSLATEPFWKFKLNIPQKSVVMVHAGEGVNSEAHREIETLTKWNLLNRKLIAIHGIGMDSEQSKKFAAVVWCPDSNMKLYGSTAVVKELKENTTILFGTDSTLSASFNLWEHLRLARSLHMLSDRELIASLTTSPNRVFNQESSSLVVAKKRRKEVIESFFQIEPEDILLVAVKERVLLTDDQIWKNPGRDYLPIYIGSTIKWVVKELASAINIVEHLGLPIPLNIRSVK